MSTKKTHQNPLERILPFFKDNTKITNLVEIPELPVASLEGISEQDAKALSEKDITNLSDLAQVDDIPEISGVPAETVEKWVKVAALLLNYAAFPAQEKKILLVGLDNAGKTSLLAVLQNKYSIVKNLLPTRGLARETLDFYGFPIVSWDLGGQIAYREKLYFAKPELFFSEADMIFFVVDMQDPARFPEALDYFKKILDVLEELQESPKLMIVLHKLDPDLRTSEDVLERKGELMAEFTKSKRNFNLIFMSSTIYDRSSIERTFSTGFKEIATPTELMRHVLQNFARKVEARAVTLVNESGFVFESFAKEDLDEEVTIQTSLLLQTMLKYHSEVVLSPNIPEERIILEYLKNKIFFICETIRDLDGRPLYLWVLSDRNLKDAEKDIHAFKDEIVPIMNFFL